MPASSPGLIERLLTFFGRIPDPTRHWATSDAPLPVFNLTTGALGDLRLDDRLEQAEFLGRPDRVELKKYSAYLYYSRRGLNLSFEGDRFTELVCFIATLSDHAPTPGEGCCAPRFSNGIQLTPATTIAQVRESFGTPESEDAYLRWKILTFVRGRYYMTFEFEQPKEQLLKWTAALEED